jgi:nucleosome assembly protein 1-like 1
LFFSPPEVPSDEEAEEEDEDKLDLLERDFDIGSILKDRLISTALLWFTGEAAPSYSGDEDDEDGDDDDDFDLDEDEDDDFQDLLASVPRSKKLSPSKKTGHQHQHSAKGSATSNQGSTRPGASSEAKNIEKAPDCPQQ